MSFSLHLLHLMCPTCVIAVHDASSVIVEDKAQADDWASEGCPQHRLDARADAPGARQSSEKERPERINEAFYGY